VSGFADLPRGLVTLEEWDALELDDGRRWELVEGGIVIAPRPRPLHQLVSGNLTQLLDERRPDSLVVLQEVEITVEARFPPTVRDPDLVVVNRSVVDRNPVRVDPSDVVLVVDDRVTWFASNRPGDEGLRVRQGRHRTLLDRRSRRRPGRAIPHILAP
jgi:Putative restriction endonuclease